MPDKIVIANAVIYAEERTIENGFLVMENGRITEIGEGEAQTEDREARVIDAEGNRLIPGFIDGHIHGADGADVMDATPEALEKMAAVLPKEGTTAFLATTITQSPETIEAALENAARFSAGPKSAEMAGIHLEGPFIEETKAGAQPEQYIRKPSISQFEEWQRLSGNRIKTITMAPEKDQDGSFLRYLDDHGINVSAGHTDAGIQEMKKATENGLKQVTHLCNAMNGIHHRDIGAVGAAFLLDKLRAELIADGIHVSPEMVRLVFQNVKSRRLMLITDAIRAKCLNPGSYDLGGQEATVTEDRAMLADGTLAGSILRMEQAAQNMMAFADATIEEVIEMTAANPAKQIGLFERKGSLKKGKDADVLVVDKQLNLKATFCRGELAWQGGIEK